MTMTLGARVRTGQLRMLGPAWTALLRPGLALWIALIVGWGAAGIAAVSAVREHRAASRFATLAGFTAVRGPGIEVVVSDATRLLQQGEDPSATLVQDGDLIALNMMLWFGGAEAVAINGERVTATSTITSSGPTILINGHRTVGPFHVFAVGDPQVLREVLEIRGGLVERLRSADIGIQIVRHRELTVPAHRGEGRGATLDLARDYAGYRSTTVKHAV